MISWVYLESGLVPGDGGELGLYQRDDEFSIRVGNRELMNSRAHASEESLATLACARIAARANPRILIGGLGMGFTLGATLRCLGADLKVVVAELVPSVVAWNRGPLATLAGSPLLDPRVTVQVVDVADVLRAERGSFDAVLLDVDNGPEGIARPQNNWLYARPGIEAAYAALRPSGVLAVWSSGPHSVFVERLQRAGFAVDEVRVPARGSKKGRQHTIWLAQAI